MFLAGVPSTQQVAATAPKPDIPQSESSPESRLTTVPIEQLQLGQRVAANNPELLGQAFSEAFIEPEHYRVYHLQMTKPDGTCLPMQFLRPLRWDVGGVKAGPCIYMPMELEEMGLSGPALVTAVEPCPKIEIGEGQLIIGLFQHEACLTYDLGISSEAEPIGVTGAHPIWSSRPLKNDLTPRLSKYLNS